MSKTTEAIQLLPELTFKRLELHLNASPTFTRRFGKKVQAAGGHYSHARGDTNTRYVYLPARQVELIAELLNEFPQCGAFSKYQVVITRDTVEGVSSGGRVKYLTLGNKKKKSPEGITKLINKWSAENDEEVAEYNRKKKEERDRVERENKERKEAEEAALDYLQSTMTKEEIISHLAASHARDIAYQHKTSLGQEATL